MAVLVGSAPAQEPAPPTRAAELRAERAAKARTLTPQKRHGVEEFLFKLEDDLLVERWLNPPRGAYVRLGGIGEGAGFGAGPGYRYSTGLFDFRASAAATMKGYRIGEVSLAFPGVERDGLLLSVYARRRHFPQEDFFGLGPESRVELRSNFALRETLAQATAGIRRDRLVAGATAGYLDPSIGGGTDRRMPSIETVFTPGAVPGLDRQPAFAFVEPFVEISTTDPALNPVRGASVRAAFARFADRDLSRYSFTRTDVDARAYIPFFHRTHTVALRAWVADTRPDDGHDVPFFLQPSLGGAYSLRGFRTFRFRDRAVTLVQTEYRWRINEFASGALFYDTGAVAPRLGEIGPLEHDYGIGLRGGSRNGVAFRLDVAFGSGEGTRILLRFNNVF
ncbi:MAG TPA: BamA/TamA family outer membrane protein [Vicinamibacterales bacterium]|nr:BamA/TamA family outer membrane protein [Vicinamibacterales bacterium]